jgi:hypothetical protein
LFGLLELIEQSKMIRLMKHPLVEKLEKRLLPEFEEVAEKIRQEIPDVDVKVQTYSIGSDVHLGHCFVISSLLKTDYCDDYDDLALQVWLERITTTPRINADVCWGKGGYEAEFYSDWTNTDDLHVYSNELFEELCQDLPRLYDALFEALRRRKPKDLC